MIYIMRQVGNAKIYKSKNYKLSFKSRKVSIRVWVVISGTKWEPLVLIGSNYLN
jgi:hypothetical protein